MKTGIAQQLENCKTTGDLDRLVSSTPLSARDMLLHLRGGVPCEVWDARRIELKNKRMQAGVLWRLGSFWVGLHYSPHNRRFCLNILPCLTVWLTLPGGQVP